ncbi:MAG: hypothetical protein ACOX8A_12495 [Thermacetogeniaceae bacterium]|jgi:hypothetical protein
MPSGEALKTYRRKILGGKETMKIINLTPHAINLVRNGQIVETLPAAALPARVSVSAEIVGEINGFEIRKNVYGQVVNLPEREEGTVYIVSALVAQAAKDRDDILVTDGAVRDADGKIIGCTGFAVIR